jgi:hypothetical protein
MRVLSASKFVTLNLYMGNAKIGKLQAGQWLKARNKCTGNEHNALPRLNPEK